MSIVYVPLLNNMRTTACNCCYKLTHIRQVHFNSVFCLLVEDIRLLVLIIPVSQPSFHLRKKKRRQLKIYSWRELTQILTLDLTVQWNYDLNCIWLLFIYAILLINCWMWLAQSIIINCCTRSVFTFTQPFVSRSSWRHPRSLFAQDLQLCADGTIKTVTDPQDLQWPCFFCVIIFIWFNWVLGKSFYISTVKQKPYSYQSPDILQTEWICGWFTCMHLWRFSALC